MATLIRITKTKIINLDQVTDFEYRPREPETVERGEKQARLYIYLTSTEIETSSSDYEGSFQGVAATSRLITLHREEAERVWNLISKSMLSIHSELGA